jgi:glucose-1-phosphate cytidylyltransferase
MDDGRVTSFKEKPAGDGDYISGGYFVLSKAALDLLVDDTTSSGKNAST